MTLDRKIFLFAIVCTLFLTGIAVAQSRRNARGDAATAGTVLTVVASRQDQKTDIIRPENINLYENGIEQKIKNFSYDPSPSKIVILIDNSQTLQILSLIHI